MAGRTRQMQLTERHVAYLQPDVISDEMPPPPQGMHSATPQDHAATLTQLLGPEPFANDEVWVFAYGSLIWKPACDFVEMRTALVHGWHRAFCLGWNTRFRGSEQNPGLMLALDRGGACNGVLYRLPPDRLAQCMTKLLEREMGWLPSAFPPRWVNARTGERTIRALTFCMDRHSGRYVTGLSPEQIAEVLAKAVGNRGSMAEYLYSTVKHLEDVGIHDPHLWQLQALVAQQIEAAYEPDR
ncbi:gamma-glutamylcyclotransferase [Devosia sp. J2-20]|jgi:glutathione-specific gamma-glutamylcyclotransferase|uniref:glutathione-specific gamma-glutamylcyclotransferase n=1 Tax=Devosia litorisediminis TaxID=2829817 RepID=A0A942E9J8_9HYPH|nr:MULTISPECIES: gamma-glutamylcyclotransferase [Devosia]MBS3850091.1 gamma-glutamylcyclotransferase [Devosia litorisediminis]WDQ99868.1 gamma-glutamylcyclotransferase [Devosia sp. J2-20]